MVISVSVKEPVFCVAVHLTNTKQGHWRDVKAKTDKLLVNSANETSNAAN